MDFIHEENRIYAKDTSGNVIAEVTFPARTERTVEIDHTFVDGSLRGQGVASQLMREAAEQIRRQNKKASLGCSYAQAWFEKHPEYADIRVE